MSSRRPKRTSKPSRAQAITDWARTTKPSPGTPLPSGFRCKVCQDPEMVRAVQGVVDLRREGRHTIGIQALAAKLNEVFPGAELTFCTLRNHIGSHVEGGWNGAG